MPGWQGLERGQLRGRGCPLGCQPQTSSSCGQCPSQKHTIVNRGQGAGHGDLPVLGQILAPLSCHITLYYTVPSRTMQCCGVLHHTRLHHSPLPYTVPCRHYTASCSAVLYHTALRFTSLYQTTIYSTLLFSTKLY